jgi:coenzyme F420 hydrogenase subunit delta
MDEDAAPDYCVKPVLILGCGNILFGDDGFGCALAELLEAHPERPETACVLDAGTGVRKLLFTICLSPVRPRRILILDAIDLGRMPGEWFEIDPADIPAVKLDDFSLHQIPTSNLLRELQQHTNVEVRVLACQTGALPGEVLPGLSEPLRRALPEAAAWVAREYFEAEVMHAR